MDLTACTQVLETFLEMSELGFMLSPARLRRWLVETERVTTSLLLTPSPLGEPHLISGALGNDLMSVIYILKVMSLNQDFP